MRIKLSLSFGQFTTVFEREVYVQQREQIGAIKMETPTLYQSGNNQST
jgi:hypothetical protein